MMNIDMILVSCAECHVPFCISQDYYKARVKDHKGFRCPNGHSNVYNQKSNEEKLREELKRTQDALSLKKNLHDRAIEEVNNYRNAELKRVEKFLQSRFVGNVKTVSLEVMMENFNMKHREAQNVIRRVKGFHAFRDEDRKYHIEKDEKKK